MTESVDTFMALLRRSSEELFNDHPDLMDSSELLPTPNVIHPADVALFYTGVDAGLIGLCRGGRFNTRDRPVEAGRWGLVSKSRAGGWYNAEYLPQLAAYVDAVVGLGYPVGRVLFELPQRALQLDLAILDDVGRVVVLAEVKRDVSMLDRLKARVTDRYSASAPDMTTTKDEARQLGWRLWTVAPDYTWLIAPNRRDAYVTTTDPLQLIPTTDGLLPSAAALGLDHEPPMPAGARVMAPPDLHQRRP